MQYNRIRKAKEGKELKVRIVTLKANILWEGEVGAVYVSEKECTQNCNGIVSVHPRGDTTVMILNKCPSVIGIDRYHGLLIGLSTYISWEQAVWWLVPPREN